MKLSCLILTKNNGKTLEYALMSICKYVDEIVLLDSGSDDNTLDIARKYTDNIFFHEFDGNFGEQKNYGMSKCRGEWIFILDADELVGENFHKCLKYLKSPYRSVALPRCHIIDIGKQRQLITKTHYYDWQTRFIRNDKKAYYSGNPVHHALKNYRRRIHCCEANIFHLDFLVNDYEKRKKKVEYYNRVANAGFPKMYLPEEYPYYTISMMELPEPMVLDKLKHDERFNKYPLNDNKFISARELCKWMVRKYITRIRCCLAI